MAPDTAAAVDFDLLVTPLATGPDRFAIDVPDGWQQGRGAFGGLVLAFLTRAVAAAADQGRRLRSLSAEIVGPVQPGPASIAVEVLRAGSGVSTVAARLVQAGDVQAHAVAAFGRARTTFDSAPPSPVPGMRHWRELEPIPIGPPMAPVFTQHIEFRLTGPLPFSGASAAAEPSGWVRLRRPGRARDSALLVALIDSFWPALVSSAPAPRPVATLTFAFQQLSSFDGLDPDAPLFYRARTLAGSDGYAVEARELFGEDGRLLALNQQTIVVMK